MRRGMNRSIEAETGTVRTVMEDRFFVESRTLERNDPRTDIYLRFELDGRTRFISAQLVDQAHDGLWLAVPDSVLEYERRDHVRSAGGSPTPTRVRTGGLEFGALIEDSGASGVCLRIAGEPDIDPALPFDVLGETPQRGWVRHVTKDREGVRVGLSLDSGPDRIPVERLAHTLEGGFVARTRNSLTLLRRTLSAASSRFRAERSVRVDSRRFEDSAGRELAAIVDAWGEGTPTAVIVPPAWGRTKETLLPLARTIVETFRAANEPVVVLRFDGIEKRGESYKSPGSEEPGSEQHPFHVFARRPRYPCVCDVSHS